MKCGEVTVDAERNAHRREWETDESAEVLLARTAAMLEAMNNQPQPTTFRISPQMYEVLKRLGRA